MTESSNLIARQPICNKNLNVIGYEILYRMQSTENKAVIDNPDAATSDVILSLFNDLSLEDVVGDKYAFINFTSSFLLEGLPKSPPKQLVIELLEHQSIDESLLSALSKYRKSGYKIALDDFHLDDQTSALIDYANIIKLDVFDGNPKKWASEIQHFKDKGIKVLAEKVENKKVFDECLDLGFDLFQGYFFAKPEVLSGKKLGKNEMATLNLLNELNKKEIDIENITKLISKDVDLSYNLLRIINSGFYAISHEIQSIKHAVTLLGVSALRNWINLLALSSVNNKPQMLGDLALLRGKMCEEISKSIYPQADHDEFFTLGIFSLIDAYFDSPMKDLLGKLSISKTLKNALINHSGDMGKVLSCVTAFQSGNWSSTEKSALIQEGLLSLNDVNFIYSHSLKWVDISKTNSH